MKKQLISSIVCFALLVVMLLGSTIAWFTDQATNVNVMVAGKIAIEQEETVDENGTVFTNNTYVMMPDQTINKIVTVTNTGNQPAYVRTLFAFEDGTIEGDKKSVLDYVECAVPEGVSIVFPVDESGNVVQFTVWVEGKETTYTVGYYQHGELACDDPATAEKEECAYICLNSITLSSEATSEWSDAVKDTYEVFVLSQASQVTGFEDVGAEAALNNESVFGQITSENAAIWFRTVLENYYTDKKVTLASGTTVISVTAEQVETDTTEETP